MEKVIGIFEFNELKKSFFLFNHNLEVVSLQEQCFPTHKDENGFDCEDISTIKNPVRFSLKMGSQTILLTTQSI